MNDWILVVDDDDDVRETVEMILDLEGFSIKQAPNGQAALNLLEANAHNPPALIYLDLWMPVLDGVGFLKKRMNDPKISSIPTYLFSADVYLAKTAGEIGATGHLFKPVEMDDLLAVANKHARRTKASF